MAVAEIHSGICGYVTRVETTLADDGQTVNVTITSTCPAVNKIAGDLAQVNAFREISYRGQGPQVLEAARRLSHPACPVPSGIIKAIEVAAGLALPAPASIDISA